MAGACRCGSGNGVGWRWGWRGVALGAGLRCGRGGGAVGWRGIAQGWKDNCGEGLRGSKVCGEVVGRVRVEVGIGQLVGKSILGRSSPPHNPRWIQPLRRSDQSTAWQRSPASIPATSSTKRCMQKLKVYTHRSPLTTTHLTTSPLIAYHLYLLVPITHPLTTSPPNFSLRVCPPYLPFLPRCTYPSRTLHKRSALLYGRLRGPSACLSLPGHTFGAHRKNWQRVRQLESNWRPRLSWSRTRGLASAGAELEAPPQLASSRWATVWPNRLPPFPCLHPSPPPLVSGLALDGFLKWHRPPPQMAGGSSTTFIGGLP